MELWQRANTHNNAHNAYKTGYVCGSRVASRVEVMRWDALYHYNEFRNSALGRKITSEVSAAKEGFFEGFAAAQKRKRTVSFASMLRGTHHPRS